MITQADILQHFLADDKQKHNGRKRIITHHILKNPKRIENKYNETVYIIRIRVEARTTFKLDFYSCNESIELSQTIERPNVYENDTITKHLGTVHFNMSNNDNYFITLIRVKYV